MKGLLFQGVRFWHIVFLELKAFYFWRLIFLHQTGFLEAFAVFNGDRVRGTPFCTHFQLQHLECNTQTILVLTESKTTIRPSQPYPAYIIFTYQLLYSCVGEGFMRVSACGILGLTC